jgi:hypothetical protein
VLLSPKKSVICHLWDDRSVQKTLSLACNRYGCKETSKGCLEIKIVCLLKEEERLSILVTIKVENDALPLKHFFTLGSEAKHHLKKNEFLHFILKFNIGSVLPAIKF